MIGVEDTPVWEPHEQRRQRGWIGVESDEMILARFSKRRRWRIARLGHTPQGPGTFAEMVGAVGIEPTTFTV
jgi:hypothetical protein